MNPAESRAARFWRQNRGLVYFLLLMFAFRSAIADWNQVPSGSMLPTIVVGDRVLVNKLAYDVRFPFAGWRLAKLADPQRGDIVVFDSRAAGKRLVKRVVGVPGDTVALLDNHLLTNGEIARYQPMGEGSEMELAGERRHRVRREPRRPGRNDFAPVGIPAGYYLVLGDNRDNSGDSRVIGLVPRDEIIGRVRRVVVSLDLDHYYQPRGDRFWLQLDEKSTGGDDLVAPATPIN